MMFKAVLLLILINAAEPGFDFIIDLDIEETGNSNQEVKTPTEIPPIKSTPETPSTKSTPEKPSTKSAPEKSSTKSAPETPSTKSTPETPSTKSTPETPSTKSTPEKSSTKTKSETQSTNSSVIPSESLATSQTVVPSAKSTKGPSVSPSSGRPIKTHTTKASISPADSSSVSPIDPDHDAYKKFGAGRSFDEYKDVRSKVREIQLAAMSKVGRKISGEFDENSVFQKNIDHGSIGDILLTSEDADNWLQLLMDDDDSQVLQFLSVYRKWQPMPIYYMIDYSTIKSPRNINMIRNAVAAWDKGKCEIRFQEVFVPPKQQYLYFTSVNGGGCKSYVSMVNFTTPNDDRLDHSQPVLLEESQCFDRMGTLMHLVGHALGLYHETQRADASTKLDVNYHNIQPGLELEYMGLLNVSENYNETRDYSVVEYDVGSIMQHPAFAHPPGDIINVSRASVWPKDAGIWRNLGQRSRISHTDFQKIAINYCPPVSRCSPSDKGLLTYLRVSYYDINDTYPLSSPGYDSGSGYTPGDSCNWTISANSYHRIVWWISTDAPPVVNQKNYFFGLRQDKLGSCLDYLQVVDGAKTNWLCGLLNSTSGTSSDLIEKHYADSKRISVIFKSFRNPFELNENVVQHDRTGFRIKYKLELTCDPYPGTVHYLAPFEKYKSLTSPWYQQGSYPAGLQCTWNIQVPSLYQIVWWLNIEGSYLNYYHFFGLPQGVAGHCIDWLEVSTYEASERFCGVFNDTKTAPPRFLAKHYSGSNKLTVEFQSHQSDEKLPWPENARFGFNLHHVLEPKCEPGGAPINISLIDDVIHDLKSPGYDYDKSYPPGLQCSWRITAGPDDQIVWWLKNPSHYWNGNGIYDYEDTRGSYRRTSYYFYFFGIAQDENGECIDWLQVSDKGDKPTLKLCGMLDDPESDPTGLLVRHYSHSSELLLSFQTHQLTDTSPHVRRGFHLKFAKVSKYATPAPTSKEDDWPDYYSVDYYDNPEGERQEKSRHLKIIIGSVVGGVSFVVMVMLIFVIVRFRMKKNPSAYSVRFSKMLNRLRKWTHNVKTEQLNITSVYNKKLNSTYILSDKDKIDTAPLLKGKVMETSRTATLDIATLHEDTATLHEGLPALVLHGESIPVEEGTAILYKEAGNITPGMAGNEAYMAKENEVLVDNSNGLPVNTDNLDTVAM